MKWVISWNCTLQTKYNIRIEIVSITSMLVFLSFILFSSGKSDSLLPMSSVHGIRLYQTLLPWTAESSHGKTWAPRVIRSYTYL